MNIIIPYNAHTDHLDHKVLNFSLFAKANKFIVRGVSGRTLGRLVFGYLVAFLQF
jgi:hypothetical protein